MADQPAVALDLSRFIETRIFGERPHIRGRRISVASIAYSKANKGQEVAELIEQYSLTRSEVLAALLYYEEHKAEIDAQEAVEQAEFEEDGIFCQKVTKLSEIVRNAGNWTRERGPYCYRGQADIHWGLVPTVFRHLAKKYDENTINPADIETATDIEIRIYEEFKERTRAYKHDRVDVKNFWEMLCLAQHFGVPTRLLDWTSNPLVAAFFAVEDLDEKRDGVIWGFNIAKFLEENEKKHLVIGGPSLDTLPKLDEKNQINENRNITFLPRFQGQKKEHFYLIQPPDIDDRMKIQSGLFTIYVSMGEKKEDDFVWSHSQWLKDNKKDLLRKLKIPGDCKHDFLIQLWRMGINRNTLFPGLSGLGQYLTAVREEWLKQSEKSTG